MSKVFFQGALETLATFWRILRQDGVTIGLTSHDRDLWFDGVRHMGSPGMLPSAIKRTADLNSDSAEVQGALTHDSIAAPDLQRGRFDGATVEIGLVDWETMDRATLYRGIIGGVAEEAGCYQADLQSLKAALEIDPVPRTGPTCRARFCGPGCTLSPVRYTHEGQLTAIDLAENAVTFAHAPDAEVFESGHLRWIDGAHAGQAMEIMSADDGWFILDAALDPGLPIGTRALLREGCDHTLTTCTHRFYNAVNFRGEPFVPGNDLLTRYTQGG